MRERSFGRGEKKWLLDSGFWPEVFNLLNWQERWGSDMGMFSSRKAKEFWGLMAGAFVLFLLSTLFKTEDLKNILIVVSAILFVIALLRLRKSS